MSLKQIFHKDSKNGKDDLPTQAKIIATILDKEMRDAVVLDDSEMKTRISRAEVALKADPNKEIFNEAFIMSWFGDDEIYNSHMTYLNIVKRYIKTMVKTMYPYMDHGERCQTCLDEDVWIVNNQAMSASEYQEYCFDKEWDRFMQMHDYWCQREK